MGSDPNSAAAKNEQTTIEEVKKSFDEFKTALGSQPEILEDPVVAANVSMMENAVQTTWELNRGNPDLIVRGIELHQAQISLIKFRGEAFGYVKDKNSVQRDKLYELSGHFVDRISQKVLEWGGKGALTEHYNGLIKNIEELNKVVKMLQDAGSVLRQYVNDQAVDSLHAEFIRDCSKYGRNSTIWLISCLVILAGFFWIVWDATTSLPVFLADISSKKPADAGSWYLLYALFPRLTFGVTLALFIFACWRNYQSYKHLEVLAKSRVNVAKLLPILRLNTETPAAYAELQVEFLRQMSRSEESGFLAQAKDGGAFGLTRLFGK
ncbi:hypothetical protein [Methylotuvimicrobium sp.]|uniref:hypothetical protein n=1 Tax=Methylotuvimicrobium sp. TaxID=2822413 RepID=UPI003D648D6A